MPDCVGECFPLLSPMPDSQYDSEVFLVLLGYLTRPFSSYRFRKPFFLLRGFYLEKPRM